MAVVDKAGSVNNLSSVDTSNTIKSNNVTAGAKLRFFRDTVEIAAADDDGSKYRLARVPFNIVISDIDIDHDSITGGTDFDLGVYDVPEENDGAVIDKDCLVDGQTLATAGTKNGLSNVNRDSLHKELWEIAGLTSRSTKLVDIVLTGNTVGTAAGTVTLTTRFSLV